MTIHKTSPSAYATVTPASIAYDIQVSAAYIAELVTPGSKDTQAQLAACNKTQLKAIAAELDTVQKRLEWIMKGVY